MKQRTLQQRAMAYYARSDGSVPRAWLAGRRAGWTELRAKIVDYCKSQVDIEAQRLHAVYKRQIAHAQADVLRHLEARQNAERAQIALANELDAAKAAWLQAVKARDDYFRKLRECQDDLASRP